MTENTPITIKEMCETISLAGILRNEKGENPTAKEIFNYSPTGELDLIPEWYSIAKVVLNNAKFGGKLPDNGNET